MLKWLKDNVLDTLLAMAFGLFIVFASISAVFVTDHLRSITPEPSAVMVNVLYSSGPNGNVEGHGSAVHLGNGLFLTAKHVVDGAEEVTINNHIMKVYWTSDADVALIGPVDRRFTQAHLPSYSLRCTPLTVGEEIEIVGNPLIGRSVHTYGRIASFHVENLPNNILMDATIGPGNSGGPVFDKDGKIVGIAVAIFAHTQGWTTHLFPGFSLAVPNTVLCDLFAKNGPYNPKR